MEVVTTKDEFGFDVVQWTWRKKAYSKRGQGIQNKMNNPAYYILESSEKNVLLAWRAPLEIDEQGMITFDEGVMPCTPDEEERLDKSFRSRNPSLFVGEDRAKKPVEKSEKELLEEALTIFP